MQFQQMDQVPQQHKQGGGGVSFLMGATFLGFYAYNFSLANSYVDDDLQQCCAITSDSVTGIASD